MSSNNASSSVTYTSVSFDSNRPSSWGIPLENAGKISDMDPYEEPYSKDALPTTKSPGYIADSNPMEDDTDADSIDYPNEPGTNNEDEDEDPEEDPSKEHHPEDEDEDPEEDPSEEHEPEDEDAKEDDSFEDSDKTEPFEENETAATPPPPRHRRVRIFVRPQTPMTASTQALIDAPAARPLPSPPLPLPSPPPINPTNDQALLGHRAAMICMRDDIPEEDMPHRRRFVLTAPPPGCDIAKSSATAAARASRCQYDFVDAVGTGQGLIRSLGHDVRTIARAADKGEDVGYAQVRRQESEIFFTQLHDAWPDRRNIRLEINVVRGQRTTYETELHKVCQAYLSSETRNKDLLARLDTLETHMSRMEWQRQRAKDDSVRQIMRTQVLKARAWIDSVEDTNSSC
ncbi:hypothetical protein Tco_1455452 [Tanacetum coccineum]